MIHDPMRDEIAEVLHAHSCECLRYSHSLDVVVAMSLIARVRADERERAAERVAALLEVFPGSGSVYKSEVVAAARGGDA